LLGSGKPSTRASSPLDIFGGVGDGFGAIGFVSSGAHPARASAAKRTTFKTIDYLFLTFILFSFGW
jgi:hypothetical protein